MLNKNKTLNEEISQMLSILKYDDIQLSNLLGISVDDLNFAKNISTEFNLKKTEKEEFLDSLIVTVYCFLHKFNRHHMTAEDCIISLTHNFEFEDSKNKKKFNSTLIDLAKGDFATRWGTGNKVVETICKINFEKYTIGDKGNSDLLLNKKISEEFFNRKVEVKEVWKYSDGGDYTELKVQELIEVYDDGSGEDWQNLKNYSTDMSEAWKLVEFLAQKGVQVRLSNKAMHNDYWWCYISSTPESNHPDATAQASSAPEAICLAVLDYLTKKKASLDTLTTTK